MGYIRSLVEKRSLNIDSKTWEALMGRGGYTSATGVNVTPEKAMQIATVFDCVKILSRDVGSLPCVSYERTATGRRRASGDYRYPLLHDSPNSEMTAMDFYSYAMVCLTLWGNSYNWIEWANNGRAKAIWPMQPDLVKVERDEAHKPLKYAYNLKGVWVPIPNSDILHIKGLSLDGVTGMSVVSYARNTFGLAVAQEGFSSDLYKNGVHFSGVFTLPNATATDTKKIEAFKADLIEKYAGAGKTNQPLVMPGVGDFKPFTMPLNDAQFLESRIFQLREVARWFQMPLSKLGENDKAATYASVEQFQLSYVIDTLRPWLVTIEQALNKVLFVGSSLYCEFLVDALLRGDIKTRYEAYATAIQWFMTRNEVRQKENMSTDIAEYDKPLQPANFIVAGTQQQQEPTALPARMAPIIRHTLGRVMARERADIVREAEKRLARADEAGFRTWLDEFYRAHEAFCEAEFRPICDGLGLVGAEKDASVRHVNGLREALKDATDPQAIKEILQARKPASELGVSA